MNASIAQPGMVPARELEPSAHDLRLVVAASSAGTVFEWYDFFIYGTLSAILAKTFFPADNATLQTLLFWLVFAVGFGFRPVGAILFGYLGDRLGRKYTFLVTVTLMGVATAGVGLIPSAQSIGMWAPALVIALRVLQGLALGGEYGGAAIYVAEHAPPDKRGFYTGFIQASVIGGYVLSLAVVLFSKAMFSEAAWAAWAWRVPFLLSIVLLAISLWMRLKLSESPVFRAMEESGETSRNPFVESFSYPGNKRRIFVALLGCAAGMTVISYTAMFSSLGFLKGAMRLDGTYAEVLDGTAAVLACGAYVGFGALSDRIGRKAPIVGGYVLTLLLLFPLYWMIGAAANPGLAAAAERAPVVVAGPDCRYDPFAAEQQTACSRLLGDLASVGVPYTLARAPALTLHAGKAELPLGSYLAAGKPDRSQALQALLATQGYDLAKVVPTAGQSAMIVLGVLLVFVLNAATYGGMAALLTEMFPPRIRYSSMSIPYHIGTGYFGGFLPVIAAYIVAKTGDPYAGLWYTWAVVAVALVVALWGVKGGRPRDFGDDAA